MTKVNHQNSRIVRILEYVERHERQLGEPHLAVYKEGHQDAAKDEQADDRRRVPGKGHTAKVETDEQHKGDAENAHAAAPVNSFHASHG